MTEKKESEYEALVARLIADMETANPADFRMPWAANIADGRPSNARTAKPYNGVNVFSLWIAQAARGYEHPIWATFKQWQDLGAQVRKGEKARQIIFYKPIPPEQQKPRVGADGQEAPRMRFILSTAYVFNAAQVDGYEVKKPEPAPMWARIEACDMFAKQTGATINYGGGRAYYSPSADHIQMPPAEAFHGSPTSSAPEAFYSTLFHELGHWTGAKARLDRELSMQTEKYAFEELIAEFCAAFLCADLGISADPRPDHAQYLASWAAALRKDPKTLMRAASQAEKAAQYLRALQPGAATGEPEESAEKQAA